MKNNLTIKKRPLHGWIPDLPDHRDHLYLAPSHLMVKAPALVDLRKQCPGVYDQGQLGSCTANAIAAAFEFGQMKQGKKYFNPSRLFIYYNERVIEHTVKSDAGAQIRNGIKSVNKLGVCPEGLWPYDDKTTKFTAKPSSICYKEALENQVVSYKRLYQNLTELKACLADGYPFVFGFSVYDSFYSEKTTTTGKMQLPGPKEKSEGGHAVMAVGYNDKQKCFIVRNSWGTGWGDKGYFYMPYEYITNNNLADDFWTIRLVE